MPLWHIFLCCVQCAAVQPIAARAAAEGRQTFLAHLRLAIVGRGESGDQPLHRDGVHWIVNGEIYNFEQLCQDHGLERRTTTDSEVVGLLA